MQFMPSLRHKAHSQAKSGDSEEAGGSRGVIFFSGSQPEESEEEKNRSFTCRCVGENLEEEREGSQVRGSSRSRGPKKTMEFMPSLR